MKKKNGKIVLVINPFFNIDQTIIFLELTFHNVYSSKYKDCIVTHPISQILTFTKFRLLSDTSTFNSSIDFNNETTQKPTSL